MVVKRQMVVKLIKPALLLVVCVLGIFIYLSWRSSTQPYFFDKKLADISIKSLKIEDKNYSIDNGKIRPKDPNHTKVSQLVSFYVWTKEDPLLTSPDLDLKGLDEAVNFLDRQQSDLLKNIKQSQHLYPTDFLKELAKVARLTDQFLDKPSDNLAYQLIDQQKQTTKAYEKDAQSLADFLSNIKSADTILFNVATNGQIYLDDIKKIAKNADYLVQQINLKEGCLKQNQCQRPALNFPKPDFSQDRFSQEILSTDDLIKPEMVFNLTEKEVRDLKNRLLLRGIYQTKTPCFGLNEDLAWPYQLFYIREKHNPVELPHLDILLATEIFFRKLVPYSEVAGDKELLNRGIKYTIVHTDNAYMCPYLGYLAEVSTLDNFLQEYQPLLENKNIAAPKDVNDFLTKSIKDEKDFWERQHPSYQKLAHLADDYAYLYRLMVESPDSNWVKKLQSIKEDLLKRNLTIKNKLGNINLVFNRATKLVEGSSIRALVNPDKDPIFNKEFTYPYRNFYDLYFMSFSPAFWRSNESLQYLDKKIVSGAVGPEGGWLSYHQALEIYSDEEIKSWYTSRLGIVRKDYDRIKKGQPN